MNYAIILAGGVGSRFWPLSRDDEPKQFLNNICSRRPMIEETISRITPLISRENIYIATNRMYHKRIKDSLKRLNIPAENIFFEPQAKNTLAPIGFLSQRIYRKDKDAVILALPCDHFIKSKFRFLGLAKKAITVARNGSIVCLGIKPDRPQTGYGYIKINSKFSPLASGIPPQYRKSLAGKIQNAKIFKVAKFIEKPNIEKAKKFLKDKRYYWNGGIFIFKAAVILEEIKRYAPQHYRIIKNLRAKKVRLKLWLQLKPISIDYAIMERTQKLLLLPVDFGWVDLGSWEALPYVIKKDKNGNIIRGKSINLGSKNSIIWSGKHLVATLGLDNIIVVDTDDALLVCAKEKAQDIKKLVRVLREKVKNIT